MKNCFKFKFVYIKLKFPYSVQHNKVYLDVSLTILRSLFNFFYDSYRIQTFKSQILIINKSIHFKFENFLYGKSFKQQFGYILCKQN